MEDSHGRVIAVDLVRAAPHACVEVSSAPACPRCAAGRGCGAGLLGNDSRNRQVDALIDDGVEIREGDQVRIALAPQNLLRASWLVYGIPLCGALFAAALAYLLGAGEASSVLAALGGIAGGLMIARRRLRAADCLRRFTPVIVERLPAPR